MSTVSQSSSTVSQSLSIYVPHVFPSFTEEYVADVFENNYYFGKVKSVVFTHQTGKDGKSFNSAKIYFDSWNETQTVADFQYDVCNFHNGAQLYHDGKWFWICLENRVKQSTMILEEPALAEIKAPKLLHGRRIRINLDDDTPSFSFVNTPDLFPTIQEAANQKMDFNTEYTDEDVANIEEFEDKHPECCEDEFGFTPSDYANMDKIEEEQEQEQQLIETTYLRTMEKENIQMRQHIARLEQELYWVKQAHQFEMTKRCGFEMYIESIKHY